jgi:hypothetical protein
MPDTNIDFDLLIKAGSTERYFKAGDIIFREGDSAARRCSSCSARRRAWRSFPSGHQAFCVREHLSIARATDSGLSIGLGLPFAEADFLVGADQQK